MAYPDTNDIIENLLIAKNPLADLAAERLGQYRLLAATQQLNIEQIREECNQLLVRANLVPALEEQIRQLEEERDSLKFWWFDSLQQELGKETYRTIVENKDAEAAWQLLNAKTIESQPDPVPYDVVLRELNGLLTTVCLSPSLSADERTRWTELCKAQVQMLLGKQFVSRSVLEALKPFAIRSRLIAENYVIGVLTESKLEQLQLTGIVKGVNEIRLAMRWNLDETEL